MSRKYDLLLLDKLNKIESDIANLKKTNIEIATNYLGNKISDISNSNRDRDTDITNRINSLEHALNRHIFASCSSNSRRE